jgi:hypothetical protein
MKRLTRAELAERVGPQPPSDAFWSRVIAAECGTISVGPEVVGDTDRRERENRRRRGESGDEGPLSPGDMIDVGEKSFVVIAVEETESGGRRYRIDRVEERADTQ